jgi:hypothetical protein
LLEGSLWHSQDTLLEKLRVNFGKAADAVAQGK